MTLTITIDTTAMQAGDIQRALSEVAASIKNLGTARLFALGEQTREIIIEKPVGRSRVVVGEWTHRREPSRFYLDWTKGYPKAEAKANQ